MTTFRCPKHDKLFESTTDNRMPGSPEKKDDGLAAHPKDGHPDCPLCREEAKGAKEESPDTKTDKAEDEDTSTESEDSSTEETGEAGSTDPEKKSRKRKSWDAV